MKRLVAVLVIGASLGLWAGESSIPVQFAGDSNAVVVAVEINGKPRRLILDTGAEFTVLSPETAGLRPIDLKAAAFQSSGPGMRGEAVWRTADMRLGGRRWSERRVVVMNLGQATKVYGVKIDGLLGQDLLREFGTVTLDFKNRQLVLTH